MSALTQTAATFKKGMKITLVVVIVYYIMTLYVIPTGRRILRAIRRPLDPPNPVYGKLAQLEFVQKQIDGAPRYVLNTKTGRLPDNMPIKMKVFEVEAPGLSYLAGGSAIDDAKQLGFNEADLISDLKGTVYKWRSSASSGLLEINKDTRVIKLETDMKSVGQEYFRGYFYKEEAEESAIKILNVLDRFGSGYSNGTSEIYLGRFTGRALAEVTAPNNGQIARIDFFRSIRIDKNRYKILGPDPKKGLLHMYIRKVSKAPSPFNYPILETYYKDIDTETDATYPIIEVSNAWNAVKQGRGVISSVVPRGSNVFEEYKPVFIDTILVNDIYMAYYETQQYLEYLQPIFVFEGNYQVQGGQGGDIVIYFPAVSGEYVSQEGSTQGATTSDEVTP